MIGEYLKNLENRANNSIKENKEDYIKNGLLYCGKCNTPKQGEYHFGNKTYRPYILCECESKKEKMEKIQRKQQERNQRIEKLRVDGIKDSKMLKCRFEFDNMPQSKNSKTLRRYCDKWDKVKDENIGLLLFGGCGTGKTFYAGCIANEIISRYEDTVIATSIPRILNEVFCTENKSEYFKKMAQASLLIIDDLGSERTTDYALEQMYTLIDERYKFEKPLIITTNLSYEEIENFTDVRYKRIYDRIKEMCVPVSFSGNSKRDENSAQKKSMFQNLFFK